MVEYKLVKNILIILLILSTGIVTFEITKDQTSIRRDGELIGTYRWSVEAERTYIVKNSVYRRDVMCPRIVEDGGYETETRCYYRPDYYEGLSRSLINTEIIEYPHSEGILVNRIYGSSIISLTMGIPNPTFLQL